MLDGKLVIIPALGNPKQRSVKLEVKEALFWKLSHSFAFQCGGFCTMWLFAAKGLLTNLPDVQADRAGPGIPEWKENQIRDLLKAWVNSVKMLLVGVYLVKYKCSVLYCLQYFQYATCQCSRSVLQLRGQSTFETCRQQQQPLLTAPENLFTGDRRIDIQFD